MEKRQNINQHFLLVLDDGSERGRIQTCASDQGAIDIFFLHQSRNVIGASRFRRTECEARLLQLRYKFLRRSCGLRRAFRRRFPVLQYALRINLFRVTSLFPAKKFSGNNLNHAAGAREYAREKSCLRK